MSFDFHKYCWEVRWKSSCSCEGMCLFAPLTTFKTSYFVGVISSLYSFFCAYVCFYFVLVLVGFIGFLKSWVWCISVVLEISLNTTFASFLHLSQVVVAFMVALFSVSSLSTLLIFVCSILVLPLWLSQCAFFFPIYLFWSFLCPYSICY